MSIELITKRFDEVFDLSLGRTPSRGDKSYWGGNHTWVSIADMSCGKYISSSKECITDKALVDTGIPLVRKGTVIMSFKLSIGKVCIANKDLYTNEAIMAFSLNGKYNILPDYLYYYLRAYKWNVSNEVVLGFTLNKKNISNSLITFPVSVSEQQRIVDILDKEFAKVEALKANAEQKLKNAKDLFQATLKKKLELKHGWVVKDLANVVDAGTCISYGIVQPEENVPDGIPIVRPVDLTQEVLTSTAGFKKTRKDISDSYKRSILKGTEILMCVRGTTGIVSLSSDRLIGCNTTRGIVPLCISDDIKRKYVYYAIRSSECQKFISDNTNGTALKQINIADVKRIPIRLAPDNEQQLIVSQLDDINDRYKVLQNNYTRTVLLCDDLKQALLRKAFNCE